MLDRPVSVTELSALEWFELHMQANAQTSLLFISE